LTLKIAIFGDIHGNIDALKAAYVEAVSRGVDRIYHHLSGSPMTSKRQAAAMIESGLPPYFAGKLREGR
jgi:hypothetical protein